MKKNLLLLAFSLGLFKTLNAQVNSSGAAEIGIPLYTFSEGAISVPIVLSYDASGIKPESMASWTGQNWELVAGAKIHRVIRDKPDEAGMGFMAFKNGSDLENNHLGYLDAGDLDLGNPNLDPEVKKWLFAKDMEPDLFILNIHGSSINFFLRYNTSTSKVETILQEQSNDIKIEVLEYDGALSPVPLSPVQNALFENGKRKNYEGLDQKSKLFFFKVTTPDGLVYWFGEKPEDREYAFSFNDYDFTGPEYQIAGNALQDFDLKIPYAADKAHTINNGRVLSAPQRWNVSRIVNYKGLNTDRSSTDILQSVNFNYKFVQEINTTGIKINTNFDELYNSTPIQCIDLNTSHLGDINERPIFFKSQLSSIEGANLKIEFNSNHVLAPEVSIPANLNQKIPFLPSNEFKMLERSDVVYTQHTNIPEEIIYFTNYGGYLPNPPLVSQIISQTAPNPLKTIAKSERLSNIVIIDKVSNKKSGYYFNYDYYKTVEQIAVGTQFLEKDALSRLRLLGIYPLEFNSSNQISINNGFILGYNSSFFGSGRVTATDHWGFFNGYFSNQNMVESPQIRDKNNYSALLNNSTCNNTSKNAYEFQTKKGILNSITYPSGSITSYDFEQNDCNNYHTEVQPGTFLRVGHRAVGGLRIKSIQSFDIKNNVKYKTIFSYSELNNPNVSSGFISFWPENEIYQKFSEVNGPVYLQYFAPFAINAIASRLVNGSYITYKYISVEQVSEVQGVEKNNGVTVYEFFNEEQEPFSFYNNGVWNDSPTNTTSGICYSKYLRLLNKETADPAIYPFFDFKKGLLKKVHYYKRVNNSLVPISVDENIYETSDLTNAINLKGSVNLGGPKIEINGSVINQDALNSYDKGVNYVGYASMLIPPLLPVYAVTALGSKIMNFIYNISNKVDDSKYYYNQYKVPVGRTRLVSTISKTFDETQSNIYLENITKLEYSPTFNHSRPIKITKGKGLNGIITNSEKVYKKEVKYVMDYIGLDIEPTLLEAKGIYGLMKKGINVPIEMISVVDDKIYDASYNEYHFGDPNTSGDINGYVGFLKKNYVFELENPILNSNFSWSTYDENSGSFTKDSRYVAYNFYNEYNEHGLLKNYNYNQAPPMSIDYSNTYNGFLPTTKSKSGFSSTTEYIPLFGVSKQTNAAGIFAEQFFDDRGRVSYTKDHKGFLNSSYVYNEIPHPLLVSDNEINIEGWSANTKIADIMNNSIIQSTALIANLFDVKVNITNNNFKSMVLTLQSNISTSLDSYNLISNNISSLSQTNTFNVGFQTNQYTSTYKFNVKLYSQENGGGYLVGNKSVDFTIYREPPANLRTIKPKTLIKE